MSIPFSWRPGQHGPAASASREAMVLRKPELRSERSGGSATKCVKLTPSPTTAPPSLSTCERAEWLQPYPHKVCLTSEHQALVELRPCGHHSDQCQDRGHTKDSPVVPGVFCRRSQTCSPSWSALRSAGVRRRQWHWRSGLRPSRSANGAEWIKQCPSTAIESQSAVELLLPCMRPAAMAQACRCMMQYLSRRA